MAALMQWNFDSQIIIKSCLFSVWKRFRRFRGFLELDMPQNNREVVRLFTSLQNNIILVSHALLNINPRVVWKRSVGSAGFRN